MPRVPGVQVPAHAVKEGRIVLNIAERAVAQLEMGNDAIRFTARFGGVSQAVTVPVARGAGDLRARDRAGHGAAGRCGAADAAPGAVPDDEEQPDRRPTPSTPCS